MIRGRSTLFLLPQLGGFEAVFVQMAMMWVDFGGRC